MKFDVLWKDGGITFPGEKKGREKVPPTERTAANDDIVKEVDKLVGERARCWGLQRSITRTSLVGPVSI